MRDDLERLFDIDWEIIYEVIDKDVPKLKD